MNKGLVIGLGAIVALFLALPVLGSMGGTSADTAAPAQQQPSTASSHTPAPQPTPQQPAPQAAPSAAPVTAADLVGTSWKLGEYTVALQAGGKMTVNGMIQGQWSLQGNTLTGSAMGQSVQCTVQNGTLYYQGQAAQRLR